MEDDQCSQCDNKSGDRKEKSHADVRNEKARREKAGRSASVWQEKATFRGKTGGMRPTAMHARRAWSLCPARATSKSESLPASARWRRCGQRETRNRQTWYVQRALIRSQGGKWDTLRHARQPLMCGFARLAVRRQHIIE